MLCSWKENRHRNKRSRAERERKKVFIYNILFLFCFSFLSNLRRAGSKWKEDGRVRTVRYHRITHGTFPSIIAHKAHNASFLLMVNFVSKKLHFIKNFIHCIIVLFLGVGTGLILEYNWTAELSSYSSSFVVVVGGGWLAGIPVFELNGERFCFVWKVCVFCCSGSCEVKTSCPVHFFYPTSAFIR